MCVNWNCKQEQFKKFAAGWVAHAHQQTVAKQSANPNKREPVLKVWWFKVPFISWELLIDSLILPLICLNVII